MKALLVGESNPYGSRPDYALYPLPTHASGGRLARILGMSADEYLDAFDRVNLLVGSRWSGPWAVEVAARLHRERDVRQPFVLLGRRVARAFRFAEETLRYARFVEPGDAPERWRGCVLLPHPSGRCRVWRESGVVDRARNLVHGLSGRSGAR